MGLLGNRISSRWKGAMSVTFRMISCDVTTAGSTQLTQKHALDLLQTRRLGLFVKEKQTLSTDRAVISIRKYNQHI